MANLARDELGGQFREDAHRNVDALSRASTRVTALLTAEGVKRRRLPAAVNEPASAIATSS